MRKDGFSAVVTLISVLAVLCGLLLCSSGRRRVAARKKSVGRTAASAALTAAQVGFGMLSKRLTEGNRDR